MQTNASLTLFKREYSALVPSAQLHFPDVSPDEFQEFLIHQILQDDHLSQFSPSREYQKSFWKAVIHELEQRIKETDADLEVDALIYEQYLSLLAPAVPLGPIQPNMRDQFCPRGAPLNAPPSACFISHYFSPVSAPADDIEVDVQSVTLLESRTTIEAGTTGLRTWLASCFLAQYLLAHQDIVTGSRVLELGCGSGFLGIIVATLQQYNGNGHENAVWLTDVNAAVLTRCQENVQLPCNLSSKHPNVNYRLLDWSDALYQSESRDLFTLLHSQIDPDIILGADLVFDPSLIPSLVAMLCLALRPLKGARPRMALIALTIRNETTLATFLKAADEVLNIQDLFVEQNITNFIAPMEGASVVKIYQITSQENM